MKYNGLEVVYVVEGMKHCPAPGKAWIEGGTMYIRQKDFEPMARYAAEAAWCKHKVAQSVLNASKGEPEAA